MDTMVGLINLTFSFKGRRENMVNRGKCWVKIVELFLWLFQYSRFGSVCGLREECRKGAFRRENPSASKRRKDVAFLLGAGKKRLEVMVDHGSQPDGTSHLGYILETCIVLHVFKYNSYYKSFPFVLHHVTIKSVYCSLFFWSYMCRWVINFISR